MDMTIRRYQPGDILGLVALNCAVEQVDHIGLPVTEESVRQNLGRPSLQPQENAFVALAPDGQLIGRVFLTFRQSHDGHVYGLRPFVHPAWRGRGVEHKLIQTAMARARQRRAQALAGPAWLLADEVRDEQGELIASLEENGFQLARWFVDMRRDLPGLGRVAQLIPIVNEPAGIRFRKWRPGVDDADIGRMLNEVFRDHWLGIEVPVEEFVLNVQQGVFSTEHSVLAWDTETDRLVGASVNAVGPQVNSASGQPELYVQALGVRREYRRRGIARELLTWSLNRADHLEMRSVGLDADAENLSGAVRLYTRLGFYVLRRARAYLKPLD